MTNGLFIYKYSPFLYRATEPWYADEMRRSNVTIAVCTCEVYKFQLSNALRGCITVLRMS